MNAKQRRKFRRSPAGVVRDAEKALRILTRPDPDAFTWKGSVMTIDEARALVRIEALRAG